MTLPSYAVDFRGFPACPCQATWLPRYEAELQRQRIVTGPLTIAQLIGDAGASGGTHSSGGASDFWLLGSTADAAVRVARQMGADATWHRPHNWDGKGGDEHVHSVLRDCPHNGPAAYQITAVDDGFNGLGHLGQAAPDDGPRPLSGRTWQEGFKWAQQQEDDMPAPKDWDAEDWKAIEARLPALVWNYVVRKARPATKREPAVTEQTAQAALKKAANDPTQPRPYDEPH